MFEYEIVSVFARERYEKEKQELTAQLDKGSIIRIFVI
jgi:hypothetical protein